MELLFDTPYWEFRISKELEAEIGLSGNLRLTVAFSISFKISMEPVGPRTLHEHVQRNLFLGYP